MSDALLQFFVQYILPVIGTAAGSLLTWGLYQAVGWIKGRTHDARFHCAMDKLTTLTEAAVLEAQQTTVRTLQEMQNWDANTAQAVRDQVVGVVKRHLGKQGLDEVKSCLGQTEAVIEGMIRTQIEAMLAKIKMGQAASGIINISSPDPAAVDTVTLGPIED